MHLHLGPLHTNEATYKTLLRSQLELKPLFDVFEVIMGEELQRTATRWTKGDEEHEQRQRYAGDELERPSGEVLILYAMPYPISWIILTLDLEPSYTYKLLEF